MFCPVWLVFVTCLERVVFSEHETAHPRHPILDNPAGRFCRLRGSVHEGDGFRCRWQSCFPGHDQYERHFRHRCAPAWSLHCPIQFERPRGREWKPVCAGYFRRLQESGSRHRSRRKISWWRRGNADRSWLRSANFRAANGRSFGADRPQDGPEIGLAATDHRQQYAGPLGAGRFRPDSFRTELRRDQARRHGQMAGPWGYRAAVRNRVPEPDVELLAGGKIAGGGARTHTILRSLDFESSASASSATPAGEGYRFAFGLRGASGKAKLFMTWRELS